MQTTDFPQFREVIGSRLQQLSSQERAIEFWWRDDDAIQWTPQLQRLVKTSADHQVPLFLAVIPKTVEASLAVHLREHTLVTVLQHGYAHMSRAAEGQKKCEFPKQIELSQVKYEIREGKNNLAALFGKQFYSVFVPPWNRIANQHLAALKDVDHQFVSCYGETTDPFYFNTHFDIINWKGDRSFIGEEAATELMLELLKEPVASPIGLLTHHLDHDPSLWGFLDFLFPFLHEHTNVSWPQKNKLFTKLT